MKKILLAFLFLPFIVSAQDDRAMKPETFIIDARNDTVMHTYWCILERGTIRNPLTMFFRISCINSNYSLDLKVIEGDRFFVVQRNAELELMLENNDVVTLYNSKYTASCRGCGARGYEGNDVQGVTLSYPITTEELHMLRNGYVDRVKLFSGDVHWGKHVTRNRSESFNYQVGLACYTIESQK